MMAQLGEKIAEVRRLSGLSKKDENDGRLFIGDLGFGDVAILPPRLERPPLDSWMEDIQTDVAIGEGRDVQFPLEIRTPFIYTAPNKGMISQKLRKGMLIGAANAQIPILTGGLSGDELKLLDAAGGKFALEIGPVRLGMTAELFKRASAFYIKPVGDESFRWKCAKNLDAEARMEFEVSDDVDIMVPPFSLDLDDGNALKTFIELLRDTSESKVPVIVDIGMAGLYEGATMAIEAGADAVCVSQDPFSAKKLPILGAYPQVLKAFRDANAVKKGIKLMISGDFLGPEDVYKGLSMGADIVGLCTGPLISAGCEIESEYDQSWINIEKNRKEWEKEKETATIVVSYIEELDRGLRRLMALGGGDDVSTLRPENLRATTQDAAGVSGLKMLGYEKTLAMWLH